VWQKVFTERQPVVDDSLFELLRQCRKRVSERENVPPFVVFADTTLREMSQHRPSDLIAMRQIKGVGEMKLQKYGQDFLAVITKYLVENIPIASSVEAAIAPEPVKKATGKKNSEKAESEASHVITLEMYRQGTALDEIAKARGLTVNTVQNHLVRCASEGRGVNWDMLIPAQYEELMIAKIKEIGASQLKPLKEAVPEAVSYAAIKAVICKHFSPAGN
jgi:ATP-dependent DNA helicase RecQ